MPLLREAIDDFDGVLENIDMGGSFDKDRLIATSNPQGIFDFSLASQGLIRPVEYYSGELAENFPNQFYSQYTLPSGVVLSGLVPPNLVQKINAGANGHIFIYKRPNDTKEYVCIQRQVGVTEALLDDPSLPTRMFGKMEILENYNKKVVFRSTNKKCYLMYNKKGGKAKNVELYVVQGGTQSATEKGMLLKIMPVLLAAKTLEEAGIKTRIYAARAYEDGSKIVFMTYPIKNYGQRLDWNEIALNVADPRIFRWKMWKAITGWLNDKFGNIYGNASKGYGATITNRAMLSEVFERYKNWAKEQRKGGATNQKEVSRLLMLIGGIENPLSIQSAWDSDKPSAVRMITDEFYRIMDSIDIQLSPMSKSANRITKRLQAKGKSVQEIKRYINSLITEAYTLPTTGAYATDKKTIQSVLEKQQKVFDAYFEWST